MLGLLVVAERNRWTPEGHFGVANAVTTIRAGLLAVLPAAAPHPSVLIGLSLLVLALDGVDGWLARRYNLTSEFGEFLDKETDALFLLLLCGLTAFQNELPIWIVGAGLLRYGFVVALFLLPTLQTTETRSTAARYVYALMVGALLLSFLPYPAFYRPVLAVAVTALLVSFGRSLRGIVVPRPS
jgi:phosphatidylglycerophosphate synthase